MSLAQSCNPTSASLLQKPKVGSSLPLKLQPLCARFHGKNLRGPISQQEPLHFDGTGSHSRLPESDLQATKGLEGRALRAVSGTPKPRLPRMNHKRSNQDMGINFKRPFGEHHLGWNSCPPTASEVLLQCMAKSILLSQNMHMLSGSWYANEQPKTKTTANGSFGSRKPAKAQRFGRNGRNIWHELPSATVQLLPTRGSRSVSRRTCYIHVISPQPTVDTGLTNPCADKGKGKASWRILPVAGP